MKSINLVFVSLGVAACLTLAGCGGESSAPMAMAPPPSMTPPPPPPPPQPVVMTYTTADILAKAQASSETDDPFVVDGGVVELTPSADQTSDPTAVDTN